MNDVGQWKRALYYALLYNMHDFFLNIFFGGEGGGLTVDFAGGIRGIFLIILWCKSKGIWILQGVSRVLPLDIRAWYGSRQS